MSDNPFRDIEQQGEITSFTLLLLLLLLLRVL